jgi:predicted dehydrogenase
MGVIGMGVIGTGMIVRATHFAAFRPIRETTNGT